MILCWTASNCDACFKEKREIVQQFWKLIRFRQSCQGLKIETSKSFYVYVKKFKIPRWNYNSITIIQQHLILMRYSCRHC